MENSTPSTGDTTETQEAAVDTHPKTVGEFVEQFDNKVTEQLDKSLPLPQPRNRAERRALKFNKKKRDHARHLDELRKEVQIDAYMTAIKRMQNLREKMEEKLNDSNEADMGV